MPTTIKNGSLTFTKFSNNDYVVQWQIGDRSQDKQYTQAEIITLFRQLELLIKSR